MFIDIPEIHNNTMVKNTTYLVHTYYIYTVMLKCINVQIYIKNGDNPNTFVHLICNKNITPHQAHILLNNGQAELTIP